MNRLVVAPLAALMLLLALAGSALGWSPITGDGKCDTSPGRGNSYVYIVHGTAGDQYDVAMAFFNDANTPDWADGITGSLFGAQGSAGITTNADHIWVRYTLDHKVMVRIDASPLCIPASPTPFPTPTHIATLPPCGSRPGSTACPTVPPTSSAVPAPPASGSGLTIFLGILLGGIAASVAYLLLWRPRRRPW